MKLQGAIRSGHTIEEGTRFVDFLGKDFRTNPVPVLAILFTAEYEILREGRLVTNFSWKPTEGGPLDNVRYIYGDSLQSL